MLALLLAATVSSATPAAQETPNLFHEPASCRALQRHVLERARPQGVGAPVFDGRGPRKLGELPPAKAEYAVMRKMGGCMVPAPVGYHQDYLLPGAADPFSTPAGAPERTR